jgi:hypothetical protein
MTQEEIIAFASSLPGVVVQTADEASGAPEVAWGDSFFYYDPDDDPEARKFPFATIVIKDYPGFDEASNLDRPGVFRLNVGVGREGFEELVGYAPAAHAAHPDEFDYAVLDQLIPHPAYATQGWVSVLNPGEQARELLARAHARASRR